VPLCELFKIAPLRDFFFKIGLDKILFLRYILEQGLFLFRGGLVLKIWWV